MSGVPPYPSVPSVTSYVNGPLRTSELTPDVTNGVNFLSNRPGFSAYCTSSPSITSGAQSAVVLDTEIFDSWSGHQGTAVGLQPTNYYCQAAGWYVVEGYVPWQYTSAVPAQFAASIGVLTSGGFSTHLGQYQVDAAGHNPAQFAGDLIVMSRAGTPGGASVDYVQLLAFTSANATLLGGASPSFPTLSCRWVGTGNSSSLGVPANAAWPVPPTDITTTWLNTNIRDTVNFLANPPILRYTYVPGSTTLASGTFPAGVKIGLNTSSVDNYSGWSAGNNNYVAPEAGVYYVLGQVAVAASTGSAGAYAAGVSVNGATVTWGQSTWSSAHASDSVITSICTRLRLNANDTVALEGFQNTGGALALQTGTRLCLVWESS